MLNSTDQKNVQNMQQARTADSNAAASAFLDYRARIASNTAKRHVHDLACFEKYLSEVGITSGDLLNDPAEWKNITWGLVSGFVKWQVKTGYAIGSINVRLATVKIYAKLAAQAGALDPTAYTMIMTIKGFAQREAVNVEGTRDVPRIGSKKAEPVELSSAQAKLLMERPNTPQGRRDSFLMTILLDHGLRAGEIFLLKPESFNLSNRTFTFYRPKVNITQTQEMTPRTRRAAKDYFENEQPAPGLSVFWSTDKTGSLTKQQFSLRAITGRVNELGKEIGIDNLSSHDCRHYWATNAAKFSPLNALKDAGGWRSFQMPLRYIAKAQISNKGVILEA